MQAESFGSFKGKINLRKDGKGGDFLPDGIPCGILHGSAIPRQGRMTHQESPGDVANLHRCARESAKAEQEGAQRWHSRQCKGCAPRSAKVALGVSAKVAPWGSAKD